MQSQICNDQAMFIICTLELHPVIRQRRNLNAINARRTFISPCLHVKKIDLNKPTGDTKYTNTEGSAMRLRNSGGDAYTSNSHDGAEPQKRKAITATSIAVA